MGLIINEDFENFMVYNPPEDMGPEGLRKQIDRYAGESVSTLIFCGNGMRAMFDSRTFEPLWKDAQFEDDGRLFFRGKEVTDFPLPCKTNAVQCKRLYTGYSEHPFDVRSSYTRSKKIKALLSMRMNDIHQAHRPDYLMHSDFWRDHPEYRREPYKSSPWNGLALDYAHEEVREHFFALLEEYVMRFDFDGIELDWMRTPPYFKPGFEEEGRPILNDFMRKARKIVNRAAEKHQHPMKIFVRVPYSPEHALRQGLDVVTWVKEELINHVTVSCYFMTTNFDMPLEIWRMLLGDKVTIAAGLDINCRPSIYSELTIRNTEQMINGFAASFYYRGADEIYLFNHRDSCKGMVDQDAFKRVLDCTGNREKAEKRPRRHVVTCVDLPCQGLPAPAILPLKPEYYADVRVNVGGGVSGRKAYVIASGRNLQDMQELRINTALCSLCAFPESHDGMPGEMANCCAWEIPENALREGDNVIQFLHKTPDSASVEWCEIFIE